MAIQVARYVDGSEIKWAVHKGDGFVAVSGVYATTGDFFTNGGVEAAQAAHVQEASLNIPDADILSPVTNDAEYICLGMNYGSHLREIGRDPKDAIHNIFFQKSASTICPPNSDVIRPARVQALDYENELGLVIKKAITGPINVTTDNLHEWIGGLVITNDVSAREDQVSCEQFNKAKSYRTFGPTGPFLVLLSSSEMKRWGELVLKTVVNGEVRQDGVASDMVHKPVETLFELSAQRDMKPGDLIATGTPGGVAMKVPSALIVKIAGLLPPQKRYNLFLKAQLNNPKILRPGDTMELTIATPDGAIDLGKQTNKIVQGD
jgi:2,4-diketo-3-deoxy-L-fuconate hydrolase